MFSLPQVPADVKDELYRIIGQSAGTLFADETDYIANAANLSALLFHTLPELNWAGFYFVRGEQLVLGPFQGKPACIRIGMGAGVCGTAAVSRKTLVVPDVERFPGHIACDGASRSEIVVPVIKANCLIGVLDLDSPVTDRFDRQDTYGLEKIAVKYAEASDFGMTNEKRKKNIDCQ